MKKKVGLALGSGSTKGFAHIGVLQVLEENRIPIDMIAGCSMGAIIGAIYAVGSDMGMLEKYVETIDVREYLDLRNPFSGGLIRGEKISELIRLFTHDKRFSETKIPYCCVAVDAKEGKLDVLDSGKLWESVRASMSIPAIFEPAVLNGKTYIDGGVLERVPAQTLKDRGADVVIGVDVGFHGGENQVAGMNAYRLMDYTISLMMWEISKYHRAAADVMIVPEVQYVKGYFQTNMVRECIEEGRRAATEAIPLIRSVIE